MCTSKGGGSGSSRPKPRTKGISEVASENVNRKDKPVRLKGVSEVASKIRRVGAPPPKPPKTIGQAVADSVKASIPEEEEHTPQTAYRQPKKVKSRTLLTKSVPRTKTRTLL